MSEPRDWTKTTPGATETEKVFAIWVQHLGIDGAIKSLMRENADAHHQTGQLRLKLRKAKEIIRWMAAEMGKKE